MHTLTRTREIPEVRSRTVMQLQTTCQKVRKDIPIEANVPCPCASTTGGDGCGNCEIKQKFRVEIIDECKQEEVPREVEY